MSEANPFFETEGLRIWLNERNQFCVARLHHTADPRKRGEAWRREEMAGMGPAKFAREYDIDYTATMGAKVFPELSARGSEIIIPGFEVPEGIRCWGGLDYGSRNPSSFHVYTIIDEIVYSIWELYEPCKNVGDFAEKIRACPYWEQIRYIAADPSIWAPMHQQDQGSPISVYDMFYRNGVKILIKGRADGAAEQAWVEIVRAAWAKPEPGFKIFKGCYNQIREFERALYEFQSERQLLDSVYRETIRDKDNHSLDDCKYFFLSRPRAPKGSGWDMPNQAGRFGPGGSGRSMASGRSPGPRGYM